MKRPTFEFYLHAVAHCLARGIELARIQRTGPRHFVVARAV